LKENLSLSFLVVALHVFETHLLFFYFKASVEPKEQGQQALLLEVDMQPTHGLLLMELFGYFGGNGYGSGGSVGECF
jgi:hypothetical protein